MQIRLVVSGKWIRKLLPPDFNMTSFLSLSDCKEWLNLSDRQTNFIEGNEASVHTPLNVTNTISQRITV